MYLTSSNLQEFLQLENEDLESDDDKEFRERETEKETVADIDQPPQTKIDNFVSHGNSNHRVRNVKKIQCCQFVSKIVIPIFALSFIVIYWVVGLTLYLYP